MKNKINKWGNSHSIRLSGMILQLLNAVNGDQLKMKLTQNGVELIKNPPVPDSFDLQKEKIIKDMIKQTDAVQTVENPNTEGLVHYIVIAVNPCKPIIRQVAIGYENSYKTLADAKSTARELIQQAIEDTKTSLADIRQVGVVKIKHLKL